MSNTKQNRLLPWLSLLLPLSGCNQYEMFLVSGQEQVSFSNKVDVLFVVDNSSSTAPYATAILSNFDVFLDDIATVGAASIENPTLTDAVGDYLTYTSQRGRITDFRMAITTTTVSISDGFNPGAADPGEAGLIVGDDPIVNRDDLDIAHRFKQNLACGASCWQGYDMPSDNAYTGVAGDCPFPEGGETTTQYLDCLCNDVAYPDGENWDSIELCGEGNEMPVEAALLAMCRAVDEPPDICYHTDSVFKPAWIGSNSDWLRDDSTVVIVVVTDEGDASQVNVGGLYENGADEPDVYLEAFAEFDRDIKFAAIGPTLTCEEAGCTTTCTSVMNPPSRKGANRLKNLADATGGFYNGITQEGETGDGGTCPVADFADNLSDLGRLLVNLQTAFELKSVPDETTIRVYVDDEEVMRSAVIQENEAGDEYSDGWSYEPAENAILFWGEAVPDFNQSVEIFYRPVDGNPRELPF